MSRKKQRKHNKQQAKKQPKQALLEQSKQVSGQQSAPATDAQLILLQQIQAQLQQINQHRLVRTYDSWLTIIWLHFLRGILFGLGTVVGATVVVWVLLYLLAQVEMVPIVGSWVHDIIAEIKALAEKS